VKRCVHWIQERHKRLQIWDSKDKNFTLSRDVTFEEASMMKPTDSQQVESKKTYRIPQHMESDATAPFLDRSVSFEIIATVAQCDDQAANQDAKDDKDQLQAMSDVQKSITVERTRINPLKPS